MVQYATFKSDVETWIDEITDLNSGVKTGNPHSSFFYHGVISLIIYKKGDACKIDNWSIITMMNIDYKTQEYFSGISVGGI